MCDLKSELCRLIDETRSVKWWSHDNDRNIFLMGQLDIIRQIEEILEAVGEKYISEHKWIPK
jgi:hypothetical protein